MKKVFQRFIVQCMKNKAFKVIYNFSTSTSIVSVCVEAFPFEFHIIKKLGYNDGMSLK